MRVLLIDVCGEGAGVALCASSEVVAEETLPERKASAEIVAAVRRLLKVSGWTLTSLEGVGIVNGPGSFTGVRTGVAAAKGICEANELKLAAVSRLDVLAQGMNSGFAALFAGRDELYIREVASGREWLSRAEVFRENLAGQKVRVAEARALAMLGGVAFEMQPLRVDSALPLVLKALEQGGSDIATVDANYVRAESDIYCKPGVRKS